MSSLQFKPKPKFHPRWRYHKTRPPQLVKSEAHLKALGEGWEDSPAKHGNHTYPPTEEQLAAMAEEACEYEDPEDEDGDCEPELEKPKRGRPFKKAE